MIFWEIFIILLNFIPPPGDLVDFYDQTKKIIKSFTKIFLQINKFPLNKRMELAVIICIVILSLFMVVLICNTCFHYDMNERNFCEIVCPCFFCIPNFFTKERQKSRQDYKRNMLQVIEM
jgi:hypothetical protein